MFDRERILEEINQLSDCCSGCQKNVHVPSRNRFSWCRANCDVPKQMKKLGDDLDRQLHSHRKKHRIQRVTEFIGVSESLETQNRPDAGTSDLLKRAL